MLSLSFRHDIYQTLSLKRLRKKWGSLRQRAYLASLESLHHNSIHRWPDLEDESSKAYTIHGIGHFDVVDHDRNGPGLKKEIDHWITAPAAKALKLQRQLPDGALMVVARGLKKDGETIG